LSIRKFVETTSRKSIAYIDGFNLYFALKEKSWRGFMWLDVAKLASSLIRPDQDLVAVKYFTSRIINDPDKQKRQGLYLDAIGTLPKLSILYGHYLEDNWICKKCGDLSKIYHEKRTDVNIATELLVDAYQDSFDDAIVVSADSDLTAPIEAVCRLFKEKTVLIVFPPGRSSLHLERVATKRLELTAKKFKKAILPYEIRLSETVTIVCPRKWRQ
jgi:uncharacterized LabA/DUF88 family protein